MLSTHMFLSHYLSWILHVQKSTLVTHAFKTLFNTYRYKCKISTLILLSHLNRHTNFLTLLWHSFFFESSFTYHVKHLKCFVCGRFDLHPIFVMVRKWLNVLLSGMCFCKIFEVFARLSLVVSIKFFSTINSGQKNIFFKLELWDVKLCCAICWLHCVKLAFFVFYNIINIFNTVLYYKSRVWSACKHLVKF